MHTALALLPYRQHPLLQSRPGDSGCPWPMPSLMKASMPLKLVTTDTAWAEIRLPNGFHSKHTGAS